MKMKNNCILKNISLPLLFILLLPAISMASGSGRYNFPGSGSDVKNLFFATEGYGQELKTSIAGQVIDVVRLQNVGNKDIGNISSGTNYISFSYEGSSGLLGFSSGYIYSAENETGFLVDKSSEHAFVGSGNPDAVTNVYMGLDVGHSISLSDDVELGVRAGVIYLEDIYNERDDGTISLLFVMPLEISNSLTIAPKVHWSHSFSEDLSDTEVVQQQVENGDQDSGSFYGGVSISFAY